MHRLRDIDENSGLTNAKGHFFCFLSTSWAHFSINYVKYLTFFILLVDLFNHLFYVKTKDQFDSELNYDWSQVSTWANTREDNVFKPLNLAVEHMNEQ